MMNKLHLFLQSIEDKISSLFDSMEKVSIKTLLMKYLPKITVIVMVFVISGYGSRIAAHISVTNAIDSLIEETLDEQGEEIFLVTEGVTYESVDGLVRDYRVHGDLNTYRFYFTEVAETEPHIYNETDDTWVNNPLDVPPLVTKAFITADLGVPTAIDGTTVTLGEDSYDISVTEYAIEIEDEFKYAPLPPLPSRIEKFIGEHPDEFSNIELVHIIRGYDAEKIYFTDGNETYQLIHSYDGGAQIGTVESEVDFLSE